MGQFVVQGSRSHDFVDFHDLVDFHDFIVHINMWPQDVFVKEI